MKTKARVIAFYLPQYYPTPENDEWWEPGFTEWTNVTRAKPLYRGHYQPRLPKDLGFYDLRVPEVRERQAQLARDAGIEGFCYWHYWFAGRRLLNRVFDEVVESGKPDYPFCLCWANHSWKAKTWKPNEPDTILIEQTYPGVQDYIDHFYAMLPAFKDKRYIKVNRKCLFGIFEPKEFPDIQTFKDIWNELAIENGLEGFCFFALAQGIRTYRCFEPKKYDIILYDKMFDIYHNYEKSYIQKAIRRVRLKLHKPYLINYDDYIKESIEYFKQNPSLTPCIIPDFDHTPRSSYKFVTYKGSTPDKWERLCHEIARIVLSKDNSNRLVFIKSWNEWGEGNYLEPDQKYGSAYLKATRSAFLETT